MKNVYILELSDKYANQVRLPYGTGLIWSFCKSIQEIKTNYSLKEWFYYKQDVDNICEKIIDPDVIIFSSFVWSWEYNKEVAKKIKKKYPNCLTICGGPQVPWSDQFINYSEEVSPFWKYPLKEWFNHHPYMDMISSGEGEITISEVLLENLKENKNFKTIPGLIVREEDNTFCVTPIRERIKEIVNMPSPYLDGTFDEILEKDKESNFHATIETTRGCPFHCSFCDQGSDYFNKLSLISLEKVKAEIKWVSENKISYLENADPNFGMFFERDKNISEFMVECKQKNGFPEQYYTTWVKGRTINSIEIMKILKRADLDRGVSMSFQSLDRSALKATKRQNMNEGSIKKTIESFTDSNIGVYVELILGLPNETLESFLDGIFYLLELGHDQFLAAYTLQVLPNTKYADPEYVKQYGLILKETKSHSPYITLNQEHSKDVMILGSKSMPQSDWITAFLYKTLIIGTYSYGSLQFIAKYLRKNHNISYKDFYKEVYEWSFDNEDTVLGREMSETKRCLYDVLENDSHWNRLLPELSDYTWNYEEVIPYMIVKNKDCFYKEIFNFIEEKFNITFTEKEKNEQIYSIVDPNINYPITVDDKTYSLNWNRDNFNGDFYAWVKECIWYGRKSVRYLANKL